MLPKNRMALVVPKVFLFFGEKELKDDDKTLEYLKIRDGACISLKFERAPEVIYVLVAVFSMV